jgi:cob(I)alamin adenosyltransferase
VTDLQKKGCVQVYTGNGKGKTTAALGLALRASGAGLRVYFAQFMKGRPTSELAALRRLKPPVRVVRFGRCCFVRGKPCVQDVAEARRGLVSVGRALRSGRYDVVILDEANVAVHVGVLDVADLLALIDAKPAGVELVLTGRNADRRVVARADLVTEMREVKHYFGQGVWARKGIEE